MDRELFWRIVEATRPPAAEDPDGFDEALAATLASRSVEDVLAFHATWSALVRDAFTWELPA